VKLELEAESGYEENYVDGLSIRWYVAVQNPTGNGFFLLEKDVDYVNMPVEEEIFAAVYLAPATIKRLTGSDRADKGAIEGVAGEVSFNGQKVAVFSSRSGDEWWKSPSLSRTEKFPLMSKGETPFMNLWWDRYLQEKENRR
jgi:hypothetical protein